MPWRPPLRSEASLYGARSHAHKVTDARVCEYVRTRARMRRWVTDTLDLDEDDIDVEDFAKSLRNGIVLCYLMNELQPRSVPRIQEKTSADFHLKENVIFFLAAIKDFGVPRHRWFSIPDLLEGASTVNVVECLSSLCEVARAKDIECAEVEDVEADDPRYSDEAILEKLSKAQMTQLKSELGRLRAENTGGNVVKIAPAIMRRRLALLTGGDEKKLRATERGITLVQAIFRGFKARERYHSMKRAIAYRQDVSREIFETEKSYAESLGVLVEVFLTPLRTTHSKLLSRDQLSAIFGDIEQILAFALVLNEELRPVVENWHTNNRLGGIFLKLMDFLKIYARYVQNFDTAIQTLMVARKKSKKLDKFVVSQQEEHAAALKGRGLTDFLIMPIQRVPRYEMLLGDLAKHTWESHPDYGDLHEAEKRMRKIGQHLNEAKRSAENSTVLFGLQHALGKKGSKLDLMQIGRSCTFHAGAKVAVGGQPLDPKKGKFPKLKPESLHIYLFNDILILTKGDVSRETKADYRGHWHVAAISAQDADTPEEARSAWKFADKGYVEVIQNEAVIFRILCNKQQDRSSWMERLNEGTKSSKEVSAVDSPECSLSDAEGDDGDEDDDGNTSVVSVDEARPKTAEEKLKRRRLASVSSNSPAAEDSSSEPAAESKSSMPADSVAPVARPRSATSAAAVRPSPSEAEESSSAPPDDVKPVSRPRSASADMGRRSTGKDEDSDLPSEEAIDDDQARSAPSSPSSIRHRLLSGKRRSGVGRLLTLRSSRAKKKELRRSLDSERLREVQDEMASEDPIMPKGKGLKAAISDPSFDDSPAKEDKRAEKPAKEDKKAEKSAKEVEKPAKEEKKKPVEKSDSAMSSLDARVASFTAWPHETPSVQDIAEAGFFALPKQGQADRCKCFSCGVHCHSWEPSDSPKAEHEKLKPACPFVQAGYDSSKMAEREAEEADGNASLEAKREERRQRLEALTGSKR